MTVAELQALADAALADARESLKIVRELSAIAAANAERDRRLSETLAALERPEE